VGGEREDNEVNEEMWFKTEFARGIEYEEEVRSWRRTCLRIMMIGRVEFSQRSTDLDEGRR
jgi:hypothetical protein